MDPPNTLSVDKVSNADRLKWKETFCEEKGMTFTPIDRDGACGYASVAMGMHMPLDQFIESLIILQPSSKLMPTWKEVKAFINTPSQKNLGSDFYAEHEFFKAVAVAHKLNVLVVDVDSHCKLGAMFMSGGNEIEIDESMMSKTQFRVDGLEVHELTFDVLIFHSNFEVHYDVGVADVFASLNSDGSAFYKNSFLKKELKMVKKCQALNKRSPSLKNEERNESSDLFDDKKITSKELRFLMMGRFYNNGQCNNLTVSFLRITEKVIKETWFFLQWSHPTNPSYFCRCGILVN